MADHMTTNRLDRIVNLDRYPIHEIDGRACRAVIDEGRDRLQRNGALELPGFLHAEAVAELVDHLQAYADAVHFHDTSHNIYFDPIDETPPASHPRRRLLHTRKGALAYDLIPANSPIRTLYESEEMTRLVGDLLGLPELHRDTDRLGACSLMIYPPGGQLGWHFDRATFAVTLMLQDADAGGAFEYVHMLRTPDDQRYDAVQRVLDGDREDVIVLKPQPGTLSLFAGTYSAHRVTLVEGPRDRINAVLSYTTQASQGSLSSRAQQLFYGRTA